MLPSRPLLSPAASAVIRVYPKGRKPGRCRVVANTSVFDRLLAGLRRDGKGTVTEEKEPDEEEGSSMVRIDSDSRTGIATEGAFGPLAVLLVGFLPEDVAALRTLMADMEADEVKVGGGGPVGGMALSP